MIHRDLKPSNVMITLHDDKAVPKVIDFGVAKATQMELTEKTLFTRYEQFIGTPAYMSPEQAQMSGLDIDTRSDIYSLGVLLYELLTGTTPFDAKTLAKAGMDEMRRMIREDEPPRPSTRLSTMAGAARDRASPSTARSAPDTLTGLLRGDLDWIVDEGAGERPHAALRDRQRLRGGHPAAPRGRAGERRGTGRGVPSRKVCAAAPGRIGRRGGDRPPAGGGDGGEFVDGG